MKFLLHLLLLLLSSFAYSQQDDQVSNKNKSKKEDVQKKATIEKEFKEEQLDDLPKHKKVIKELEDSNPIIYAEGYSELRIETSMSDDDAKNKALEQARIKAIEDKLGKVIFQGNSVYVENTTTGQKVESSTKFNSISESYVKGTWVSDDKVSYEILLQKGERWMTCKLKGYLREVKEIPPQFRAEPLNCDIGIKCRTTSFVDGASLYLYFSSAVSGYLSVFLTDKYSANCVLPYTDQPDKLFYIEKEKEYYLFSSKVDKRPFVQEFELFTESNFETDILYVLFSEKEFIKPLVLGATQKEKEDLLSPSEMKKNVELPKRTSSQEFMKWLAKARIYNPEITVKSIPITIQKN